MTPHEFSAPEPVKIGTHVELELLDQHGGVERLSLEVVEDRSADFEAGFLGASTPLARIILGQLAGRSVPYRVGDLVAVRILAVTPGQSSPDAERAKRREETIRKAISDSDRTNALLFASSFSGKWGDYDPEGVESWDQVDSTDVEKSEDNPS